MACVTEGNVKKGDVLGVARVAGIMGVKKTSELIPMCHPLPIQKCAIDYELDQEKNRIHVLCTVKTEGKTGVEMEALTGVQVTLLTIYDMCKAIDKHMVMSEIHLIEKTGGKIMKKAILATKVGMTQIFNADGVLVPVTVLQAGPCVVTQIKTVENDGYSAVQVGFVDKKEKVVNKDANGKKEIRNRHGVNKAQMGHFAKAGVSGKRFVKEFKFENAAEYNLGDVIKADIFAEGDKIDATAISKGKGFQGAIKRFGQHRGPMAHGSKFHRHQGSNGACSSPSRVFKGKGMPGHMGSVKVTTQNLEVVRVDAENNLLLVKGAVPGAKKCLVTIKETVKAGK